jgi:hypothetical protein
VKTLTFLSPSLFILVSCFIFFLAFCFLRNKTESGWGPNAVFRFPQEGGTGGIWKKVAKLLPKEKQRYGVKMTNIIPDQHLVELSNGHKIKYNKVNTSSCRLSSSFAFLLFLYLAYKYYSFRSYFAMVR